MLRPETIQSAFSHTFQRSTIFAPVLLWLTTLVNAFGPHSGVTLRSHLVQNDDVGGNGEPPHTLYTLLTHIICIFQTGIIQIEIIIFGILKAAQSVTRTTYMLYFTIAYRASALCSIALDCNGLLIFLSISICCIWCGLSAWFSD